eukprot:scaffold44792_cov260-Amphora_coffeaeformis.AAC.1
MLSAVRRWRRRNACVWARILSISNESPHNLDPSHGKYYISRSSSSGVFKSKVTWMDVHALPTIVVVLTSSNIIDSPYNTSVAFL